MVEMINDAGTCSYGYGVDLSDALTVLDSLAGEGMIPAGETVLCCCMVGNVPMQTRRVEYVGDKWLLTA